MSDGPCQLCGKENACLVLYICWFDLVWHELIAKDLHFNKNGSIGIATLKGLVVVNPTANIMNLSTGKVMKHCYKRKFPEWTKDVLQRSVAVATGQFPPSFKPSVKKKKPMQVVHGGSP